MQVPVWFRLFSSLVLQRLVPDRLIPVLAALHARAQWLLSPRRRAAARQAMSNLVGGTSRSSEVEPLARQHLLERSFIGIARWRPWMLSNTRLEGHANLEAAIARRRGVLLTTAHIGVLSSAPLLARGYTIHVVANGPLINGPYVGQKGHLALSLARRVERAGGRLIAPPDSFDRCRVLLERGELCWIAFDVAGEHETTFLGKTAGVRSGIARLALETGAQVVPIFVGRSGHRLYARLGAPIDPGMFPGVHELIDHLSAVVGKEMLARPSECTQTTLLKRFGSPPSRADGGALKESRPAEPGELPGPQAGFSATMR